MMVFLYEERYCCMALASLIIRSTSWNEPPLASQSPLRSISFMVWLRIAMNGPEYSSGTGEKLLARCSTQGSLNRLRQYIICAMELLERKYQVLHSTAIRGSILLIPIISLRLCLLSFLRSSSISERERFSCLYSSLKKASVALL